MKNQQHPSNILKAILSLAAALAVGAAAWAGGGTGPKIESFAVDTAAGASTLRFPAEAGTVYELQRASVLVPEADWATVDTLRAEASGTMELTDAVPKDRTRNFYRIAEAASPVTYLVVDMSQGSSAAAWPVTELRAIPEGGWTDEYKTGKLVLARIPAGTFVMGSPTNEMGRASDETPHTVTISRPFYMGVFEVTQKQWELATGKTPSENKGDARPVEKVSYADIRGSNGGAEWPQGGLHTVDSGSFLYILRAKTGLAFDLPTEAQWEYACRADTVTALNSGKDLSGVTSCTNMDAVGRYWGDKDDGKGGYAQHTRAGSYRPNAWGLHDMHGNVWEWCLDWYGDYPSSAVTDPAGPSTGSARVKRGGGWDFNARYCRSAARNQSGSPSERSKYSGFRVVCPDAARYIVVDMAGGPSADSWPVEEKVLSIPDSWSDEYKTTKLLLRRIPAGTFTMGSPTNERGHQSDETQHQVRISQPFYMGVFEVTQKQWELATGNNPSEYTGDTRPVENVSYNDIRGSLRGSCWPQSNAVDEESFLAILRDKTGLTFDLPTEAQWEYACRAGTTTALNNGKNLTGQLSSTTLTDLGRYSYNTGDGRGGYGEHAMVGSYLPNAWGLYDMHGNVWEWCLDWFGDYDAGAVTDPEGASTGSNHANRGGSWIDFAADCRSACRRGFGEPTRVESRLGFRLACPGITKYLVVDMAGGRSATKWPVRELDDAPAGGWSDEYKTTKLVLRRIPAGTFTMGSPEDELGHYVGETQHQVTISKPFFMGVFEVTQKQWELTTGRNYSSYTGDARPVEQVSYADIRGSDQGAGWPQSGAVDEGSFLYVLREKTWLDFDLPTEAQWEYACRAGTTTALNSGKNLSAKDRCPEMDEVGRYSFNGGEDDQHAIVGSYRPNAWGLYDMHGNVSEWCLDWYDSYDLGKTTDPAGASSGSTRVFRGGSWYFDAQIARSACRGAEDGDPEFGNSSELGLRLAVPVP